MFWNIEEFATQHSYERPRIHTYSLLQSVAPGSRRRLFQSRWTTPCLLPAVGVMSLVDIMSHSELIATSRRCLFIEGTLELAVELLRGAVLSVAVIELCTTWVGALR